MALKVFLIFARNIFFKVVLNLTFEFTSYVILNNDISLYLKGDNLLDQEKRDHTSFLKDKTLMGGRSIMLGVTGDF